MDRDALQLLLAQGQSVEQIGRRFGRHPSTVSYWLRKHGLEAPNRAKHAAKGGIERERLTELVGRGLTIGQIAQEVGLSKGAVRHWLGRYGLRTRQRRDRRPGEESPVARPAWRLTGGRCALCGYDRHVGALHLRRLAPAAKRAKVGAGDLAMSLEGLREEARGWILLCSNCHAEVDGGVRALPLHLAERPSAAVNGLTTARSTYRNPG